MKTSTIIVFALCASYCFTQCTNGVAATSPATGCKSCNTKFFITLCAGSCPANCAKCDGAGACQTPAPGYYLNSGTPTVCNAALTSANYAGCKTCDGATGCTAPNPTFYVTAAKDAASCVADCLTCSTNADCSAAVEGKGKFVAAGASTLSTCGSTVTAANMANCKACDATGCTSPMPGYYIASNAPVMCSDNTATVKKCDVCTATACTTAAAGYWMNGTSFLPCPVGCFSCNAPADKTKNATWADCTQSATGFGYLATATGMAKIFKCIDGCETCTDNTTAGCTCAAGKTGISSGSCTACGADCSNCFNATICYTCSSGFALQSDFSCSAVTSGGGNGSNKTGSSSLINMLFALISVLIYLF